MMLSHMVVCQVCCYWWFYDMFLANRTLQMQINLLSWMSLLRKLKRVKSHSVLYVIRWFWRICQNVICTSASILYHYDLRFSHTSHFQLNQIGGLHWISSISLNYYPLNMSQLAVNTTINQVGGFPGLLAHFGYKNEPIWAPSQKFFASELGLITFTAITHHTLWT